MRQATRSAVSMIARPCHRLSEAQWVIRTVIRTVFWKYQMQVLLQGQVSYEIPWKGWPKKPTTPTVVSMVTRPCHLSSDSQPLDFSDFYSTSPSPSAGLTWMRSLKEADISMPWVLTKVNQSTNKAVMSQLLTIVQTYWVLFNVIIKVLTTIVTKVTN